MAAIIPIAEDVRAVHVLSGRVRIYVPGCDAYDPRFMEQQLRRLAGVRKAQVNPLTSNALLHFDPQVTDVPVIVAGVRTLDMRAADQRPAEPIGGPPVALRHRTKQGVARARIAVRGLDRDPHLAGHVVAHLQKRWGVIRVVANPLTGRVLIEFSEERANLGDLISEVAGLELPGLLDEDRPSHPLDPGPLLQSATRTAAAGLALGALALRQIAGRQEPLVNTAAPTAAASVIGILQGFPVTRNSVRALLGRHLADLAFQGAAIVSLLLSGSPLGLALSAAEAVALLTEVVPRRRAWRRYEDRLADVHAAHAGAVIRVESGEKTPLPATVIEGTGTATGHAGLPEHIAPGDTVSSGCRLYGGPFVLLCRPHKAFAPEPRRAPPRSGLYERYTRDVSWLSLAYAGLTALLTRSFSRTFTALLLVNPRTAVIGAESADLRASARALRANVTVVGTRPERQIRLPDLLLLDGPRVLTEGFEVQSMVALSAAHETAAIAEYAAGIAAAAGSPWGSAFSTARGAPATEGSFDGKQAVALFGGVRFALGPVTIGDAVPPALHRQYRGSVLLALRNEREQGPIGIFVVQPQLAPGVSDLVAVCRRHGVEIKILARGNAVAGQMVAHRAGVEYLDDHDALRVIRARQSEGDTVAFLSDSAGAGQAFAECDLAIGLFAERTHHFPARADLLAPDLHAVAAIIEAGARRRAAVRDAVVLSLVGNGVGAVLGLRGQVGIERGSQVTFLTALGAMATGWLRLRGGEQPS